MPSTSRMAYLCCMTSTSSVTRAETLGLPSRSPPIQVPNVSGRAVGSRSTLDPAQLRPARPRHPGRYSEEVVEVVHGVARLVGRLRPDDSQLVGLPQQVDHLGQPFLPTLTVGGVQQVGDAPQLGERACRAASVGCAVKTGRTASR